MTPSPPTLQIVLDWHQALNTGDTGQLTKLVDQAVELVGPRGSVTGLGEFLDWVERAKVSLIPQRLFQQGEWVLVEEVGQWHSAETGAVVSQQVVATLFAIKAGRVSRIQRFESLPLAFEALSLSDDWTELPMS